MSAADKLAQVLAEHPDYVPDDDSSGDVCAGCFVKLDPDGDSHAGSLAGLHKHQAAVVLAHLTAEGWAQGREEFATKDGEDEGVTEIEPPTREWAERVAAADNAYLRRTGFKPNITVVRRRVTDWAPVETGDQK